MNKKDAAEERKRLFKIIEDLVIWENTTNEAVLQRARAEIRRSWREVCELNKDHPQATELFSPEKLPALQNRLSALDARLRNKLNPAAFVWDEAFSPAFPASEFWYLYRRPAAPKRSQTQLN